MGNWMKNQKTLLQQSLSKAIKTTPRTTTFDSRNNGFEFYVNNPNNEQNLVTPHVPYSH